MYFYVRDRNCCDSTKGEHEDETTNTGSIRAALLAGVFGAAL